MIDMCFFHEAVGKRRGGALDVGKLRTYVRTNSYHLMNVAEERERDL